MTKHMVKTPDGKLVVRIETSDSGQAGKSTAEWCAEQIAKGTLQDEIEDICGASITGAWKTWTAAKAEIA